MQKINLKKLYRIYHLSLTRFTKFLDRIKHFPWFSVLLLLLLGWGGYQVATKPKTPAAMWFKRSAKQIEMTVRKAFAGPSHIKEEIKASAEPFKAEEEKPSPLLAEPLEEQVVLETEKPAPEPLKPVKVAQTESVTPSVSEPQLAEFEGELKRMQAALDQLKAANSTLRQELDSLRPQLENIHHALNAQAQQLSEVNVKETQEEIAQKATSESFEEVEAVKESDTDYAVYAVIQGRAWLNTPEGKILTVRIGSILPPFGAVQSIDTERGLVYFDQGHVIGLSENDS